MLFAQHVCLGLPRPTLAAATPPRPTVVRRLDRRWGSQERRTLAPPDHLWVGEASSNQGRLGAAPHLVEEALFNPNQDTGEI